MKIFSYKSKDVRNLLEQVVAQDLPELAQTLQELKPTGKKNCNDGRLDHKKIWEVIMTWEKYKDVKATIFDFIVRHDFHILVFLHHTVRAQDKK